MDNQTPPQDQTGTQGSGQSDQSGTPQQPLNTSPQPGGVVGPPQGMFATQPPQASTGQNPFGDMPTPPPPPPGGDMGEAATTGDPNYMFGSITDNFQTSVKIPAHNLIFDENYFLKLLAGSISLTIDEKRKIVQSIPRLKQEQIDELIRILEEERSKFQELSPKHSEQLKKLEQKHWQEWQDLEVQVKAEEKATEDQAKADEIRKKLGL